MPTLRLYGPRRVSFSRLAYRPTPLSRDGACRVNLTGLPDVDVLLRLDGDGQCGVVLDGLIDRDALLPCERERPREVCLQDLRHRV